MTRKSSIEYHDAKFVEKRTHIVICDIICDIIKEHFNLLWGMSVIIVLTLCEWWGGEHEKAKVMQTLR